MTIHLDINKFFTGKIDLNKIFGSKEEIFHLGNSLIQDSKNLEKNPIVISILFMLSFYSSLSNEIMFNTNAELENNPDRRSKDRINTINIINNSYKIYHLVMETLSLVNQKYFPDDDSFYMYELAKMAIVRKVDIS